MTINQLINTLDEMGWITVNDRDALDAALDATTGALGVDGETPIPIWNPDAEAWEV